METMNLKQQETHFHVLAVDDSLIDRKLLERLLTTYSYQVTTFDSGSKALEYLGLNHENEVNLIITDYCMPGMTGYDLLKKIKGSSSLKDIPVVVMSSENLPSRINRCLEGGAEEFFVKPVQLSDMSRLTDHLMQAAGKRSRSSSRLQPLSPVKRKLGISECHNNSPAAAGDKNVISRSRSRLNGSSSLQFT